MAPFEFIAPVKVELPATVKLPVAIESEPVSKLTLPLLPAIVTLSTKAGEVLFSPTALWIINLLLSPELLK